MVALSYANLATDLIAQGRSGRMVALRDGKYIPHPAQHGHFRHQGWMWNELYDKENYRPKVASMLGKPMFLY